jgi:Regulator of chromosome condensation (RCC1) repeat
MVSRNTILRAPLYCCPRRCRGHNALSLLLVFTPSFPTFFVLLAATDIICGHSHTLVRASDGRLYTWGRGDSGELGQGNLTDRTLPAQAKMPEGHIWTCASAGSYYSVAVAEPGVALRKTPADVNSSFEARYNAIYTAQETAIAKYTGSGEQPAEEQPADAAGGEGEATAADPNALPPGWDYEYTADGQIYFISPDGSTTWDDPRG